MPSSSGAGITDWSPPPCSPTPDGTSACSRPRTGSAAPCARRSCTRASPRTCSRRSTPSTRRRRSCRRWISGRTGCACRTPRWCSPIPRDPTGNAPRSCSATGRRRQRAWPRSTRATATRGSSCAGSGTRSATRCCARSSRRSRRSAARWRCCGRSVRPRRCASPGSSCCRRSGWARNCSRAKVPACCSRATPRTRTRRSTRRSAGPSAGCWRCSARSTGSPCRWGARASWPRRWSGAPGQPERRCTADSPWSGSTYAAAGPSPCTPRAG